jgi:hypothetical protein
LLLLCGDHALQLAIPHLLPLLAHLLQWPSLPPPLLQGPHKSFNGGRYISNVCPYCRLTNYFFSLTAQLPDQEVLWKGALVI